MSLTGIVLGLINIIIVIVILLLIGALVKWILKALLAIDVPAIVEKLYLALVGLIALYMLVAMLLGIPTWAPVRF
jgi:hypothetical protein